MPNAAIPPAAGGPADHDHDACVAGAMDRADALCLARGARLTPVRRRVLELVWRGHRPRGAYDILEDLGREGRPAAPLTVYRALDFLVGHGLVHRLESLNAFIGCADPERRHPAQFLVCEACGSTTEVDDDAVTAAIEKSARALGFNIARPVVEVSGRCARCTAATA